MADGFRVTFTLGKSPLLKPDLAMEIMISKLTAAVRVGLFEWERKTTRRTPLFRGVLRSAWQSRVEVTQPLSIVGMLINTTPYAKPVNDGQSPHFPPVEALEAWAQQKLGDKRLAFVVARSIARGTTQGTAIRGVKMLEEGFRVSRPHIVRAIRRQWGAVIREISA